MSPSQSIKLLRAFWSKFNTLVVSCNYCWKVTATYIVHTAVHIYVVIHVQKKTSARCSTPPALLLSLSKYSFSNDGLIMSQRQVKSHREKKKRKRKKQFSARKLKPLCSMYLSPTEAFCLKLSCLLQKSKCSRYKTAQQVENDTWYPYSSSGMAIRVVEFSSGVTKLAIFLDIESMYLKEIIEFWELG